MSDGEQPAPRRVLVVEDEGVLAFLLEDMLLELGHTVVAVAARVEDALALRKDEYDFAILDVNLNGQDSYGLAEKLRAAAVPFIFTTGYGASGLLEEWRSSTVLSKPFMSHELRAAIRAAIAGSAGVPPIAS
ncbi:MAG TPA: response regulator [Dongiaceae bacterium]|jgi:DNA-binding response OmpR family regulator